MQRAGWQVCVRISVSGASTVGCRLAACAETAGARLCKRQRVPRFASSVCPVQPACLACLSWCPPARPPPRPSSRTCTRWVPCCLGLPALQVESLWQSAFSVVLCRAHHTALPCACTKWVCCCVWVGVVVEPRPLLSHAPHSICTSCICTTAEKPPRPTLPPPTSAMMPPASVRPQESVSTVETKTGLRTLEAGAARSCSAATASSLASSQVPPCRATCCLVEKRP